MGILAPKIPGREGSAGAPKGLQSAATLQGAERVKLDQILQISDPDHIFGPPRALADPPTSTVHPLSLLPPSIVLYDKSSFGGAQNWNSGHLQAETLYT